MQLYRLTRTLAGGRPRALVGGVLGAGLLALWGCDGGKPKAAVAAPSSEAKPPPSVATATASTKQAPMTCKLDRSFPAMWSLAEASAAVEVELLPGVYSLIAFADSGHNGDAMLWPVSGDEAGKRLQEIHLPLDRGASDDIEGAAWSGGHLYTLTSSGAVRRFTPSAEGVLARDRDAYPLGPSPYVCPNLRNGNCGKNYEGLCLRGDASAKAGRQAGGQAGGQAGAPACAGYAASKTEGALYCVVYRGDALAIDLARPPIKLDVPPHALSDCAFGSRGGPAEGTLLVTTNIYGGGTTYLVHEARGDGVSGELSTVDVVGLPNNEGIAVDHTGALYQFMDGDTNFSPAYRTVCRGWPSPEAAER